MPQGKIRIPSSEGKINIYLCVGEVFKLFDSLKAPYAKPNVDIIKRILHEDYLPGIKEKNLTDDGNYKCLMYKYLPDRDSDKISLDDFKPIMETLDKLHENHYVHSDVRLPNMVFAENSQSSKLIDFDLMDKVGVVYPDEYNADMPERHRNAQPNMPREIIHDRYSLIKVICMKVVGIEESTKEKLKRLGESKELPLMTFFEDSI